MELLWRWSFGLGMLALAFFVYSQLRQAVLLSDADVLALSGHDPIVAAATAWGLLAGAMGPLLRVLEPVFCVAVVLWIAATTVGRGIITRVVVRRFAADYAITISPDAPRWSSFAILNFARVLMLLILVIGYLGGTLIAGFVSAPGQNVIASTLIVFASLAAAGLLWSFVNWVLSLAPIFIVRDGRSPVDAIVEAIAFLRRNYSHLAFIAVWNGILRGLAATVISIAGMFAVALRPAPTVAIAVLLVLEMLLYLIISDLFLLARLGAYASVAVRELTLSQSLPAPPDRSGTATR
jgi:hypothetical protein